MIKALMFAALVLAGCASSAKPASVVPYTDGWRVVDTSEWSFKLPPSFHWAGDNDSSKELYRSIGGDVGVSFSTEHTTYDLETYSSALILTLADKGIQWTSRKGNIDGRDAVLVVAKMTSSTVFHVSIVENSRAYNFNCVVDDISDNGTVCGKIAKTIKIK